MATYSDAELQQLMVELESDLVERKESTADLSFDSRPAVGIELEDLDMEFLRDHYLPAAEAYRRKRAGNDEHGVGLRSALNW